ncbi:hypothetical protein CNR27_07945 [Luteimonas chenhongjianii]|uniref:Uncharacterized protein n=1 Tax=Luteimonas chenhongjianii TaxID=2006110 RepID=A0A290XE00_9GAMM|nr:hypothetical protein [Luteimonas chenhongjianii]ATD67372.1 hypothetical protein CNR27_07945 [Luteimonas chenhongjianii]
MPPIPSLALATLLALAIVLLWRHARRRRRLAFARVLDAADAFEARLRTVRARLGTVEGDPVREALQEMLRQRLWLQQHGGSAGVAALDAMRVSIEQAQARIDRHLADLTSAIEGGVA